MSQHNHIENRLLNEHLNRFDGDDVCVCDITYNDSVIDALIDKYDDLTPEFISFIEYKGLSEDDVVTADEANELLEEFKETLSEQGFNLEQEEMEEAA